MKRNNYKLKVKGDLYSEEHLDILLRQEVDVESYEQVSDNSIRDLLLEITRDLSDYEYLEEGVEKASGYIEGEDFMPKKIQLKSIAKYLDIVEL